MQCPNDGAVLVMSERSGIEIDYCPTCRGVWLDRGELDKILERATQEFPGPTAATPPPAPPQAPQQPLPPQQAQPGYNQGYNQNQGYGQNQGFGQNPMDALRQMTGRGYDDRDRGYDQGYNRKKKKDNWLSELFD